MENISGGAYDLETILADIKKNCGVGVFMDPDALRSALKDYHAKPRDVILLCSILEDYGSAFGKIVSNPTPDSIARLSEKIADDRFIDDVTIVEARVDMLVRVINGTNNGSRPNKPSSTDDMFGDDDDDPYSIPSKPKNNPPPQNNNNFVKGHSIVNGACGPNLKWRLDRNTGYMEIKGAGPMFDIEYDVAWDEEREKVKTVVISEGVTSVSNIAFNEMPLLEYVSIPNSVISVGDFAFSKCTALKSIVIPEGVIKMGAYVFDGCISLSSVYLPNSLKSAGGGMFDDCISLRSLEIPKNVAFWDIPEWCAVTKK